MLAGEKGFSVDDVGGGHFWTGVMELMVLGLEVRDLGGWAVAGIVWPKRVRLEGRQQESS